MEASETNLKLKLKIYVEKLLQSGWKDWIKIMKVPHEGCAKILDFILQPRKVS